MATLSDYTRSRVEPNRYTIWNRVTFPDCDPAGIVYYPRYFDMMQRCKEAWTVEVLGSRYHHWFTERSAGFPTRALSAEFYAPTQLSQLVSVSLSVQKLGNSSLHLRYQIRGVPMPEEVGAGDDNDDLRMQCDSQLVVAGGQPLRAMPIPDDLRAQLQAFMQGR